MQRTYRQPQGGLRHAISFGHFSPKRLSLAISAAFNFMCLSAVVVMPDSAQAADLKVKQTIARQQAAQDLDWVPIEQLTEEQKKRVPTACCGAYLPPARSDAEANLDPSEAPIHAVSEDSTARLQKDMSLTGKVTITQGKRSVTTDNASYNQDTSIAQMTGGVQLRDDKIMVRAQHGTLNTDTGDADFNNTKFVLYETRIHGTASRLKRFGDSVINLQSAEISSCEPGDNAWSMRGSEIELHPEDHYGYIANMRLRIDDIPVVYSPYIRFPLGEERLTGFLSPTFTHNTRNGWDMSVPFYWNMAPNYDATFTPRYMSERGTLFETEFRHLSDNFKSLVNYNFLNNDQGTFTSFHGEDRWYERFVQDGGEGEAWSTHINYANVSDTAYLRDMSSATIDTARNAYVRQMASVDYRTEHWYTVAKVDEYRLMTATQLPYRELPRINANANYRWGDWVLKADNEFVSFVQNRYVDQKAMTTDVVYGERFSTDYRLTWDKSVAFGFFRPTIAAKSLSYDLTARKFNHNVDTSPTFVVPQASVDMGLFFERNANVFGGNYNQTLEPRVFYFYSQYKDQGALYHLNADDKYINFDTSDVNFTYDQLFRTSRFAGGDRLDDANQTSLALTSAFISPSTGLERLRMSVGQIFYAEDRRISIYDREALLKSSSATNAEILDENRRSSSDVVLQVSGQLNRSTHISADAAYDQRNAQVDYASAGYHYLDSKYRILNLVYRYSLKPVSVSPSQPAPVFDQSLDQVDASVVWPMNNQWSVIARSNYDFKFNVELDTFAGFEYNDCCFRVRMLGRRWLRFDYTRSDFLSKVTPNDYDRGVMLSLELKGLGGMDQKIKSLLDRAVVGYDERAKHLQ